MKTDIKEPQHLRRIRPLQCPQDLLEVALLLAILTVRLKSSRQKVDRSHERVATVVDAKG